MTSATRPVPSLPILLVDDEEHVLDITRMTLRSKGITNVITLNDSRRVMPLLELEKQQVSLVMLDLMMPSVDGYAVLDSLSRLVSSDDLVPVIVLTADASVAARRRALALGARDFVSKPFDLIEVALRISNLLEMRMLHRRLMARISAT